MRIAILPTVAGLILGPWQAAQAAELGDEWSITRGQWVIERELIPIIRQTVSAGPSAALCGKISGEHGAWRAVVQSTLGAKEAGISCQAGPSAKSGFQALLGGNPEIGGFVLRSANGKTLWEDRWAPWRPYHPYWVEGVIERGRVRAQLFEWDGKTLISQSPWVNVPEEVTETTGMLGLCTQDGIARFWACARADKPLSPVVEDAPNKRRLVQDDDSPWAIIGPGNWMWTTAKKQRLRQYAVVERTKAVHRGIRGALRKWECRVKVDPKTGGAGMYFQANETTERGLLAWLGGTHGAGSLMLYQMPASCKWSGKQGNWRYNTEYVLRAETRKGEARAQLLKADGKTVIQDTSWVKVGPAAEEEGFIGFHTWKGTAEFWGFSENTSAAGAPSLTAVAAKGPSAAQLGDGWQAHGDGSWSWADDGHTRLRQTGQPKRAIASNRGVSGIKGHWRCHARIAAGAEAAGLAFQSSRDLKEGFACLLTSQGFRLERLDGKALWEDTERKWTRDKEYVLEGQVMTDRIALRVFEADGKTLVAECPDVYVPEANNHRTGYLGLVVCGGAAEFWGWELR